MNAHPNRLLPPRAANARLRLLRWLQDKDAALAATVIMRLIRWPDVYELRPVASDLLVRRLTRVIRAAHRANPHACYRMSAQIEHPGIGMFKAWIDVADDESVVLTQIEDRDRARLSREATCGGEQEPGC